MTVPVGGLPSCGIRQGSVYLPAALAETYFPKIGSVILMIRGTELLILPVARRESGGCLLKQRNAAGDRVASAPDLFALHAIETKSASGLAAIWSSEQGGLCVPLPQTWFTE